MKQIASPSTAMNLANGTLHTKLSFLQEKGSRQSPRQTAVGVPQIPALVQHVQDAAHVFFACVAKYGAQSSLLQEAQDPNATTPEAPSPNATSQGNTSASVAAPEAPSSPSECKDQKEALEKTYVKAYVELARLTAEYAELSKSTACEDQVIATYEERAPALQEAAEKLSKLSTETAAKLKELRPRLDGATEADKKLRQQFRDLTDECENLPETISDLGKVRDAITALSFKSRTE